MTQRQNNFDPWSYTTSAAEAFGNSYNGRSLIARDTSIAGRVCIGVYGGPAITVDTLSKPEAYDQLYGEARRRASVGGIIKPGFVFNAVYDTVKESMSYSQEGVDRILTLLGTRTLQEVDLSVFIRAGAGTCLQQALASGMLLERFTDEGTIAGRASLDRNMDWKPTGDEVEGHAWARYTSSRDEVWIVDVAGEYNGPLEYSPGVAEWNYFRPEDNVPRAIGIASVTPSLVLDPPQ